MGRQIKESDNYTSRIIDLDIIDYNNTIYNNLDLKIPHPHMSKRNFVLYPLRDIDSHYCNPVTGKKIDELLAELDDESITVVNISK